MKKLMFLIFCLAVSSGTLQALTVIPPSPRDQVYSDIGKSFGEGLVKGLFAKKRKAQTEKNQNPKTNTSQAILELFLQGKFDECFILCEPLLEDNYNMDDVFAIRSVMVRCPVSLDLREKAALNADVIIRNSSHVDTPTLGFAWTHKSSYALILKKNDDALKYAEVSLTLLASSNSREASIEIFQAIDHFNKSIAYTKLGFEEESNIEFRKFYELMNK